MNQNSHFDHIAKREAGLSRQLTAKQMSMIAIGGALGTGLFLGSAYAIDFAGPSIIISYTIGALITLLLMGCLAEMTVAHPTSGSFGAYAEHYISPLAGFLVRYAYWSCIVLAVGAEVTAAGLYMQYWFPHIASWIWVLGFSALLVITNIMSVRTFGTIEYWFSLIKVSALVFFILIGLYVLFATNDPAYGIHNYFDHGGFFPNGFGGMWKAVIISIFSYLSIEMIAIAAGESTDPERAVKQAFKATILRLGLFYLLSLSIMLAIVPWNSINHSASPFVTTMKILNIPGAAAILNFVLIIAALSAMNSQLYTTTRMMFSLSRANQAPKLLGKLNQSGVPVFALMASTIGILVSTLISILMPQESFALMMALSIFGALFTWLMIFVTHWFFRKKFPKQRYAQLSFKLIGFPYTTLLGIILMLAIILTTWFVPKFELTLVFGLPFLACLTLIYYLFLNNKSQV